MNLDRRWFSGIAVLLFSILASVSVAFGQAAHVRWDIVSFQGGNFLPGGVAAALAESIVSIRRRASSRPTIVWVKGNSEAISASFLAWRSS